MTLIEQVFAWLEQTDLSLWIRGESLYGLPLILVFHTIGMGLLAGTCAAIALRILGVAKELPLAIMEQFYPAIWFGFAVNAASGVLLFLGYPYKAVSNPVFWVKLACIATGVYLAVKIRKDVLRTNAIGTARIAQASPAGTATAGFLRLTYAQRLAVLWLMSWMGAIFAGRLLAYTYVWLRVGVRGGF